MKSTYCFIYVVWLKDRITNKKMCYSVSVFDNVPDYIDNALKVKIQHTDTNYVCYKVDFKEMMII